MRITVTAPTGNIGRVLTERLLDAGTEVTLIARSPEKVSGFIERGAHVIEGSLEDPATVQAATETAEALFWLTPSSFTAKDIRAYQNSLGEVAARVARSRPEMHVVNLSSVGAHLSEGTGPIKGLHDVEQKLNAATRRVTHLRPTYFMENVLASLPTIVEHGAIFSTVPAEAMMNQIATADIAVAAAETLLGPAPDAPRVVHIMGAEEVSFDSVAETVSEAIGKQVSHVVVSADQLRQALRGTGASADLADQYVEMEEAFRLRLTVPPPGSEIRRGSTAFQEFARDIVAPAYGQAGAAASA